MLVNRRASTALRLAAAGVVLCGGGGGEWF